MSIVHTIPDQQLRTIYRTLSSGVLGVTAATIQLLTKLALVAQSSTSDMLYRMVVSGFNAWPKLLSKKGSMREKEIQRASKKQRTDQWADIRSYAVSLLVAILSNGNTTTKEYLLGNYLLISPLVKFLPLDRDSTIIDLLTCLSDHILPDKKISRSVKSAFFNTDQLLYRIISLHGRHTSQDPVDLDNVIREFLCYACTTTGNGICFEDRGWYPRLDPAAQDSDSQIHNGSLLRFLQRLQPLENDFHRSLTLEVLKKCAELRAPYFSKLLNPTQPSLTFSFISEVNFLIEIINLPLPKEITFSPSLPDEPPPTAVVLANLLPTILTKQYLTNAVGHQSALVRHSICLLILTILNKVRELKSIIGSKELAWQIQLDSILESISRRLPEPSSILTLYSKSADYSLTATCSIKVLLLYSELLSSITSTRKVDAKSIVLAFQKEWSFMTPIDILDKMYLLRFIHEHSEIIWWSRSSILHCKTFADLIRSWSIATCDPPAEAHFDTSSSRKTTNGVRSRQASSKKQLLSIRHNYQSYPRIVSGYG